MRDDADNVDLIWSKAAVWSEAHQAWSREGVSDLAGEDAILVDARHCRCPVPVQRLHGALSRHAAGQVLMILADDPSARRDIPDALRFLGHRLLSTITCGSDAAFISRHE